MGVDGRRTKSYGVTHGQAAELPVLGPWHRGTVPYHHKHMKRFALYLILFNFNTTKIKVVLAVNHYQKYNVKQLRREGCIVKVMRRECGYNPLRRK